MLVLWEYCRTVKLAHALQAERQNSNRRADPPLSGAILQSPSCQHAIAPTRPRSRAGEWWERKLAGTLGTRGCQALRAAGR